MSSSQPRVAASCWLALVALSFASASSLARAQDVPSNFVSEDKCASKPCTCNDIPMMEKFQKNQENGGDAWGKVKTDILMPTGPSTAAEAITDFQSYFTGDADIVTQFKTCPNYDASKNNPNKVAGVSPFGTAAIDPCFCVAFCKDIIDATLAHERTHVPTIILGVISRADITVGCKLGSLSGRICGLVEPLALADSEIVSYAAGVLALQASIDKLMMSDPSNPDVECTWKDPAQPAQQQAALPIGQRVRGFFARVALLFDRIVNGTNERVAVADTTADSH